MNLNQYKYFGLTPIWWLLIALILGMLVAGLDPKRYRFRNEVTWNTKNAGLHFGRFARVHTEPFITPEQAAILNRDGFTIEAAVRVTNIPNGGYRFLASFHSGDDQSQLVVGQWREHFVVMNGNDYSRRRGLPRITADTTGHKDDRILLTITTGTRGTCLYLNGQEAAAISNLHLTLPAEPGSGRLVIGNSVKAINPWNGDVFGFAAYSKTLKADQISRHYAQWSERMNFSFARADEPFLLYAFDEGGGQEIRDQFGQGANLKIPDRLVALNQRAFAPVTRRVENVKSFISDVILNVLGFIPFGFVLATIVGSSVRSKWKLFFVTTTAGFFLSFVIELAQAWMPSRDSSLLDLLMNTAGTVLGAAVAAVCSRYLRRSLDPVMNKSWQRQRA